MSETHCEIRLELTPYIHMVITEYVNSPFQNKTLKHLNQI